MPGAAGWLYKGNYGWARLSHFSYALLTPSEIRMNRLAYFFPGLAMLIIGAAKVWTHTHALQAFLSVRCGPEGLASAPGGPTVWTSLLAGHCWGCPVSFVGGAMILVAAAMQIRPEVRWGLRMR